MIENNNLKMGLRDGIPIGIGYFVISFAVGVFASSMGLSWVEAFLISALNFTSAGEIAAIPLIAHGGSLLELAVMQLIINSRYALMSISLSQRLTPSTRIRDRLLISFFNADEVFALCCSKECLIGKRYYFALAITPYVGWVVGTVVGAVIGGLLPAWIADTLSISLYAMIVTIITEASKASRNTLWCVLSAIALSFAFAYLPLLRELPNGVSIIIITVALSALFAYVAPVPERDSWEEEVSCE